MSDEVNAWDYIVVGAGSAGCVLASRLSKDPACRVLLLEAGPPDRNPMIHMPLGVGKILQDPKFTWSYQVEREAGSSQKPVVWMRGKTLGGSSSVNGMLYMHGDARDYDDLVALGHPGWGWSEISRCFREIENHGMGPGPVRGDKGPLKINNVKSHPAWRDPVCDAVVRAGGEMGLPVKDDLNDGGLEGIAYVNRNISGGQRQSAAKAFLDPARSRPNLTILTGVCANQLVFEGQRVVGVRGTQDGVSREWRSRREVIVSAGALESPKLLQLSGIGPGALLQQHGIAVRSDLPGVGGNLREHHLLSLQYRLRVGASRNNAFSGWRLGLLAAQYLLFKSGILASSSHDVASFVRTREGLDRPDAQINMAPYSLDPKVPNLAAFERFPGISIHGYPLRPISEGRLQIRSADPTQPPLIRPNTLQSEYDRQVAVGLVRCIRRLAAQPSLAAILAEETQPGLDVQTDEQIIEAFIASGQAGYHATGTCKMGHDDQAVVDSRLRVRGVTGLRVMDLSVLPAMLSGNTNGPVMALAWRASELIAEDARQAA